jgi:hypothetical protein
VGEDQVESSPFDIAASCKEWLGAFLSLQHVQMTAMVRSQLSAHVVLKKAQRV